MMLLARFSLVLSGVHAAFLDTPIVLCLVGAAALVRVNDTRLPQNLLNGIEESGNGLCF